MPGLVHKIAIHPTTDGLILHPVAQRTQRIIPSLQIQYSTYEVISLASAPPSPPVLSTFLNVHGIVGFLSLGSVSYLIVISQRQQVAQIKGVPVYVITGVAFLPLSSLSEAEKAVAQAKETIQREFNTQKGQLWYESDTSDDSNEQTEDDPTWGTDDHVLPSPEPSTFPTSRISSAGLGTNSSVAQDVISRRGQYGRFADRWFSKKGWSTERRRDLGMSANDEGNARPSVMLALDTRELSHVNGAQRTSVENKIVPVESSTDPGEGTPQMNEDYSAVNQDVANTLLPKLLQRSELLLSSRSFFFSYSCDITRRLGSSDGMKSDRPLHKSVDPLYFWNRHLAKPLIEGRHHTFILPLMQGFVGQREFSVESMPARTSESELHVHNQDHIFDTVQPNQRAHDHQNFLITLISRRSVMRPGLRYLRRGIDEEGHTANSVETEQILSRRSWTPNDRVYSFTQVRGSIPLYFSQSPYSFKPVPVLQHSHEVNHIAFRHHFKDLSAKYGGLQMVSLVNKTGGERVIGMEYEKHTQQLNDEHDTGARAIGFEWFDFHEKCRGFNFSNVSLLTDSLAGVLEEFDFTIESSGMIQKRQSGVFRTNCMDCLDRTNVVQSAFGQMALQKQLKKEGTELDIQTSSTTQWFNTLWSDQGDSISRQYSSTAALKGDYTRTRKRNYRGAINDFGLTLSRYFNNIVNDYFSQAAVDYLLGNVTSQVFEEFEAEMMSGDPAMSISKIRANAIDTSLKIVIADQDEDFVGGWTLLSPQQKNTVRTFPFEEVVLLLTKAALYAVRFDWNTEKVSAFERVDLQSIFGIIRGTYITSTLVASQMDEEKNVGFVIKYHPTKENITRINTRSLENTVDKIEQRSNIQHEADRAGESSVSAKNKNLGALAIFHGAASPLPKILAFKALPARSSLAKREGQEMHDDNIMSEKELVRCICDEVEKAVTATMALGVKDKEATAAAESDSNRSKFIEIEDENIISLREAKKSTGLLELWGHSLKKLVWA